MVEEKEDEAVQQLETWRSQMNEAHRVVKDLRKNQLILEDEFYKVVG